MGTPFIKRLFFCLVAAAVCAVGAGVESVARVCREQLVGWNVPAARSIAERAVQEHGRQPALLLVLAQVRFYEARYQDSIDLMDEAKAKVRLVGEMAKFEQLVRKVRRTAESYVAVNSPHFSLRLDPRVDSVLVEPALDALEKTHAAIAVDLGFEPVAKVVVEVSPDADSFVAATTLDKADIERSGTIAICKFNRLVITSPRVTLHGYRWQDTLCHEYVHYALMKSTGDRVPLWLHEGTAKYHETRWRAGEGGRLSPLSSSLLAEAVEAGRLVSFERMCPTFAKLDGREATLAFAQVHTMVDLIVRKHGEAGLRKLLTALAEGAAADQAMHAVMGTDVDGFQKAWLKDLKRRKLVRIPGLAALTPQLRRNPDGKEREEEEIELLKDALSKQAADYVRLGDMLRVERRPRAALIEYGKADKSAQTVSPVVRTRLAFAHMEALDFPQALATLERVRRLYPDYQPAHALTGALHHRQQEHQKAIEALKLAVAINPFDYVSRTTLADAYNRTGQHDLEKKQREAVQLTLPKEQP